MKIRLSRFARRQKLYSAGWHAESLADSLLIATLAIFIFVPLVITATNMAFTDEAVAKQQIVKLSALSWNKPEALPKEISSYFSFTFPFRQDLVNWNNFLRVGFLNRSPFNVVVGESGWLFLDDQYSIDDFRGLKPLTDAELEKIRLNLEAQRAWLTSKGIYSVIAIVPNKETVYPEFLPGSIKNARKTTRLDQLMEYFGLHSDIEIINLRSTLLEGKAEYPVFHHTDSHWNSYGAFLGYQEIMQNLSSHFPQLRPHSLADFHVAMEEGRGKGDLASLLLAEGLFPEELVSLIPAYKEVGILTKKTAKLPSAMVFHDSFYDAIEPFLTQDFERLVTGGRSRKFDYHAIEQEKPDVVIYLVVERLAPGFLAP